MTAAPQKRIKLPKEVERDKVLVDLTSVLSKLKARVKYPLGDDEPYTYKYDDSNVKPEGAAAFFLKTSVEYANKLFGTRAKSIDDLDENRLTLAADRYVDDYQRYASENGLPGLTDVAIAKLIKGLRKVKPGYDPEDQVKIDAIINMLETRLGEEDFMVVSENDGGTN